MGSEMVDGQMDRMDLRMDKWSDGCMDYGGMLGGGTSSA